jgi:hypothetical protein
MTTNTVSSTGSSTGSSNNAGTTTAVQINASDIIPGTNWTWGDASSMRKECERDARLFGRKSHSTRRPRLSLAERSARRAAKFLADTGWTLADATNEAIESRRDRRLHGAACYASV